MEQVFFPQIMIDICVISRVAAHLLSWLTG